MTLSTKRLVSLLTVLLLLAAACGSDAPDTGDTASLPTAAESGDTEESAGSAISEVTVAGFAFAPDAIEVPAGATVVWTNEDTTLHTVTPSGDDATAFGGGLDGSGTTVEATFDEPGTYEYFCSIHPSMTGTVTVT